MTDARLRNTATASPTTKLRVIAIGVALSGLWMLSLSALITLLTPQGWWGTAAGITAVVTLLACLGLAGTRLPHWLVVSIAGATGFALWGARFAGSGRLQEWTADPALQLSRLQGEVLRGIAPMDPTPFLQDVVLLLVWVWSCIVILVLSLIARPGRGVPGALAAALLIAVPPLFIPLLTNEMASTGILLGMVALIAVIVWLASARVSLLSGVAAAGAFALAAGAFAVVPEVRTPSWNRGVQYAPVGGYVDDVTIELARDLQAGSTVPVLTYTSDLEQAVYLRLATLSTFEGGTWLPDEDLDAAGLTVGEERVLVTASGDASGAELAALRKLSGGQRDDQGRILVSTPGGEAWFAPDTGRLIGVRTSDGPLGDFAFEYGEDERQFVDVSIAALRSSWLPLPSGATEVVGDTSEGSLDTDEWVWSQDASTAASADSMTERGDAYRALLYPWGGGASRNFLAWLPPELLRVFPDAAAAPSDLQPYLELPGTLPPSLEALVAEFSDLGYDRADTAFALEHYFRNWGGFTYDEAAPYVPGVDPESPYGVMDAFLTTKTGYCVHFATTFATIARSLGVPTRVAVGYASRARGETPVAVRGKELHAWPEVYIDNVGWIPFEPTPGGAGIRAEGGGVDSAQTAAELAAREDDTATPEAPGSEDEELAGEMRPLTDEELAGERDPASPGATDGVGPSPWVFTVAALLSLLLLAAVPSLLRAVRRTRRVRAIRRGADPARKAWGEFEDLLRDYGRGPGQRVAGTFVSPHAKTPEALVAAVGESGSLST
ncbi:MAG: transglutaminase domain-containing protein, partial [Leucobacter sp.]|nr:transglutaminase domain-containing protein [Leucobacter sp.]